MSSIIPFDPHGLPADVLRTKGRRVIVINQPGLNQDVPIVDADDAAAGLDRLFGKADDSLDKQIARAATALRK